MAEAVKSLLLRFAGPAQSWGGPSLAPDRIGTELVPTRSGTLGLLAACLGAPRNGLPAWLADTRVMVRVDRPGEPYEDFHTVNPVPDHQEDHYTRLRALSIIKKSPEGGAGAVYITTGDGKAWKGGPTAITKRRFLADAVFMVAIEHDTHLDELVDATRSPRFVPYLGRKAYPPVFPFHLGTSELARTELLHVIPTAGPPPANRHDPVAILPVTADLPVAELTGDRNRARDHVTVPVTDKKGVLSWASEHLAR
jgi:CRISPR system Cascade subunit CasD